MPVAYTSIASADKAAGAPVSTTLVNALDFNVQALAEGGAPFKILAAALEDDEQMNATNVGAVIAGMGTGAIGSYIYSKYSGVDTTISFGEVVSSTYIQSAATGNWKSMSDTNSSAVGAMFLWKRVS